MRYAVAVLCVMHAVAHIVGFVVPWRLLNSPDQPYRTTILQGRIDLGEVGIRVYGLGWLAISVGFMLVATGVLFRSSWWLQALGPLVAVSLFFCVLGWPDTRLGIPVNLLVLGIAFAALRFGSGPLPVRNEGLEVLWKAAPSGSRILDPAQLAALPEPARRYAEHVIASGTPLASSVRLTMHGEIKLDRWHPFHAEQVISSHGEFIWAASTSLYGLPIIGSDRLIQGDGSMQWKGLDLFPVVRSAGRDTTRSAIGRLHGEWVAWLPSAILADDVKWSAGASGKLQARVRTLGEATDIELDVDGQGRLRTIKMRRWGNPGGGDHRYEDFGVLVEDERTFGGFTVPSRIRAGWFFGTERFESEGEFFRATVDSVTYK